MTPKRYRKLFMSEMSKLMAGKPGAGECIRATSKASHFPGKSYADSWNAMRVAFIYKGNTPPIK